MSKPNCPCSALYQNLPDHKAKFSKSTYTEWRWWSRCRRAGRPLGGSSRFESRSKTFDRLERRGRDKENHVSGGYILHTFLAARNNGPTSSLECLLTSGLYSWYYPHRRVTGWVSQCLRSDFLKVGFTKPHTHYFLSVGK